MAVISKCPHCGAQIVFEEKAKVTACKYCESFIAIQEVATNDNSSTNYVTKEIIPDLEYLTHYYKNDNEKQKTGYLWITENELLFRPSKLFNFFEDANDRYIRLSDICGYRRCRDITSVVGFDTGIFIYIKDGNTVKQRRFEAVSRQSREIILNNIEYYRKQYYITKGEAIPALNADSIHIHANKLLETTLLDKIFKYIIQYYVIIILAILIISFIPIIFDLY